MDCEQAAARTNRGGDVGGGTTREGAAALMSEFRRWSAILVGLSSVASAALLCGCIPPAGRTQAPTIGARGTGVEGSVPLPPAHGENTVQRRATEKPEGAATARRPSDGAVLAVPLSEPSAIAYHPTRRTLWLACDSGSLVEMDLNYRVLSEVRIRGDLEGVAVHPGTGNIWVASERDGTLLEYDIGLARVVRKLSVDFASSPEFGGVSRGNTGIEGVTFAKERDGRYRAYCAVQSAPARVIRLVADVSEAATARARAEFGPRSLAEVDEETAGIDLSFDAGLDRLSDITFVEDPPMLVVISSGQHAISSFELRGVPVRRIPIVARRPEGLCFLPNGDAIIAMDVENGLLLFRRELLASIRP